MKKYFIIKDGEQNGPYTMEELKEASISRETMVWYDGLSAWMRADTVSEIKSALFASPPPYAPSPPVYNAPQVEVDTQKSTHRNVSGSLWRITRVIVIGVIVLFGVGVLLNVLNNPRHNSYINVDVNPPNPRVVETHAAEDPSSKIFAYREAVYATVINQGGAGKILVSAQLIQGSNVYNRTQEIFLSANQSQEIHFVFTEARALGGNMEYSATAKGL